MRIRDMLVESPGSLGAAARLKRWKMFQDTFPEVEGMRVVDLGGRADTWLRAPARPKHVVVVNLGEFVSDTPSWIEQERGDACDLGLPSGDFDLVFSNSLLEHVGGHYRRERFARSVEKLAARHWIQTPYRYFPVEPHWLFPGLQFMPLKARARIAKSWRLSHSPSPSYDAALRAVMDVELVSLTEMKYYFPNSDIVRERIGPFVKSLIAVRR